MEKEKILSGKYKLVFHINNGFFLESGRNGSKNVQEFNNFFYSVGYILILKPAGVKSGPADASRKVRL